MDFTYRFPAVKGVQARREYYIAMVPMRMLKKLFGNDEEYVLPEYRAQRRLNENRIPEIKNYIVNNRDNYVFSALAASIDGSFNFLSLDDNQVGVLEVSMDATFLINDGQHRKAAILSAIEEDNSLANETIPIVFFEDMGLARSQQMFTDLNKHAVKTSNSIVELYDSRDLLAVITRNVVAQIPFLNDYVDKEKDNLGKFSSSLFTLNTFYNANKKILGRGVCDESFEKFVLEFWNIITCNMVPWNELVEKEISKRELKDQYIATQAVVIQAIGRVGACVIDNRDYLREEYFKNLRDINWKRSADIWRQRVIRNDGRMINNTKAIILTANVIKEKLGIPLSQDDQHAEEVFLREYK